MDYLLMHKKIAVALISIDEISAAITEIKEIYQPDHLPLGVDGSGQTADRESLYKWWSGRAIPASRSGLREALGIMGAASSKSLLTKCYGLSLSDQYWVNPVSNPLDWEKVNFFENPFSEDVGNALFGDSRGGNNLDLISPCNTSDGWLKKKWIISNGKRVLVKGGSNPFQQEPLNELVASAVMKRLSIPHVPYTLMWEDGKPYSLCDDFITTNTELVSAYQIMVSGEQEESESSYDYFLRRCEELGIPKARENVEQMLAVDFLIANSDRHYNNFGAVRNAETLEWVGLAPVYDSGTSLWFDQAYIDFKVADSRPFENTHDRQIELVSSFDWLDFSALEGIYDEARRIYSSSKYIDPYRAEALASSLEKRCGLLEEIADKK